MARIREHNINSGSFWDDQHNKATPHNVAIATQFERLFSLDFVPKDKSISLLDVGCGNALHFQKFSKVYPNLALHGLDISQLVTEKNKLTSAGNFICLDIERENLTEVYDYIVSFHTFEHFTDPVSVLKKCLNHAREKVIICVPYEDAWALDETHIHKFSLTEPFEGYVDYKIVNNDQEIFYVFEGLAK